MSSNAKFLEGSLFGHITTMSLTASVGLMAIFLVDFVDMLFISMLGKEELAAAIGYAGAIFFFTSSLGIGLSIAAGALVGTAVGAGDEDLAGRRAATALIYGVVFSSAFAVVVWFYLAPLSALMGASGATLDLELTGAALASVAARFSIGATAFFLIVRDHGGLQMPTRADLAADFAPLRQIAVPAILTQLATPIGSAYITRSMAEFGEAAVAGMAIVGRITPVAFAVIFALSGAIGPIIAQNHGAGQEDRVIKAFREGLLFTAIITVFVAVVLFFLREPIVAIFEAEGIAKELVFLFCGPLALAWFFNGTMFVANSAFNNLGHPYYSTWLNWGRNTLGTIPFVILGSSWLGATGVLIGQAAGGVAFGLIAIWLGSRVVRNPIADATPALQHGTFHSRVFQLRHHRR